MYLVLFLLNLLCSKKLAEFRRKFSFIVISVTWWFNFQMVLFCYISSVFYISFSLSCQSLGTIYRDIARDFLKGGSSYGTARTINFGPFSMKFDVL